MFLKIEGVDEFKGDRLCHPSKFKGANATSNGKKAVVVGCCNSGHDIAQDFHEHGYDVTIVQRSSTYVMSSKAGLDILLASLYEEGGPATEDADLLFMSIPNAILKRMHMDATREISRRDADLLAGLEKAGFKLDNGLDDSGFFMRTSNEAVAITLTWGLVSLSSTARSRPSRVRRSQKSNQACFSKMAQV